MISDPKTENEKLIKVVSELQRLLRDHQKWLLLIGTGPSIAVNRNMGMGALREHLLKDHSLNACSGWGTIADRLRNNLDLEQALSGVPLNRDLLTIISKSTGDFVADQDALCRDALLTGDIDWPCSNLLRILVQRLPRSSPRLPIVTLNYDLFIEYACSRMGVRYTTGYVGGVLKKYDWGAERNALFQKETTTNKGKRRVISVPVNCVEIMKVHGSINLFMSGDGTVIESDIWTCSYPETHQRLLAPPGDLKDHAVTQNREAWFAEADRALRTANAFLVIGYGFNDYHVHNILKEKAKTGIPIIILTRDPSPVHEKFCAIGENIWILTGAQDLGGDTIENSTLVKNRNLSDTIEIENERLWSSDIFVSKVIGE